MLQFRILNYSNNNFYFINKKDNLMSDNKKRNNQSYKEMIESSRTSELHTDPE